MPAKKPSKKIELIDLKQFRQELTSVQQEMLLSTLETRFEQNSQRHPTLKWTDIKQRLQANPEKLQSLHAMESTGGEPDVVEHDSETDEVLFCDCSAETPNGRLTICYDGKAQQERNKKGVFPAGNAVDLAKAMGIELITEQHYRHLQTLGEFDLKTSSWIYTPEKIRKLGGALFADRRYDTVFVYHNSAPSFYSARGFRGVLSV